jgi:hypothetical protein
MLRTIIHPKPSKTVGPAFEAGVIFQVAAPSRVSRVAQPLGLNFGVAAPS